MTRDIRLALMTGIDIPIVEYGLTVHQPSMKEIAVLGESEFLAGIQMLTVSKELLEVKDKTELLGINNFQIFMMAIGDNKDKKNQVKNILSILFPVYKVLFTPTSILLQKDQESILIDEQNFEDIQGVLKEIFCIDEKKIKEEQFNPGNAKAREIAEKIKRGRQRVAELKSNQGSVFAQYLSSLCIGLHIPLDNLSQLTMYQLYDLLERFSLYVNWDIDLRCRLAGGSPDSQPENWMKNIH